MKKEKKTQEPKSPGQDSRGAEQLDMRGGHGEA